MLNDAVDTLEAAPAGEPAPTQGGVTGGVIGGVVGGAAGAATGAGAGSGASDGAAAPNRTLRRSFRPAPATRRRSAAPSTAPAAPPPPPSVQSYAETAAPGASGPLNARILFLPRGETEPDATFYGYIVIGPDVSPERKSAVAEGFACRLDALPDVAAAEGVSRLGLVMLPASRDAGAGATTPAAMLSAYDFPRAGRWLRAAAAAAAESFDPAEAVLFIGSNQPRSRQLDSVALPGPAPSAQDADALDPVIADASALSARYLSRWTSLVIDGVRDGAVASRQQMQGLMEAHSWLESVGGPLAAVLKNRAGPGRAARGGVLLGAEPPAAACF